MAGLFQIGAVCVAGSPPAVAAIARQPIAESIGDGVVRFFADQKAQGNALPSFSLERPRPALGPAPKSFTVRPEFSSAGGKQTVKVVIDAGTSLYGTGEAAGPLLRSGRRIVNWNTDAFGYGDDAPSLYKSFPWVLAVRADGSSFGVLADTTYRCEIDLRSATTSGGQIVFNADGPAFPVIVIDKPSPLEVVTALADLTGKIAMPPKWALGYHQCRYSYFPEAKVKEIAGGFRTRDIPCDVIWLDIDYMDGFRCFTWDKKHFPDPKELNDNLHTQGFHTVWMIDPGIKAERGYFVFDQGTTRDAWVKKPDGKTDYNGEVWPGNCVFPDYTKKDVRTWWAGLYKDFMATGVDGVWNDMNEPAVFNTADKSKTMPEDNVHRADPEFGGPGSHARFHNVYGTLMVKATLDGIAAANPDKRPFVLSRALFLGGQRHAASWTGDNSADWYHLESSIPMVLNLSLSGQPFCGPDIGGFAGNGPQGEAGGTMFARWMGIGALLPFARAHTAKGNIDKEPWSFGPKVEATCRAAIERRYRLLPYIYTLFHEASTAGAPIARPLFFADPKDPALRSEDDGFFLGDALMVIGQMVPDRSRAVVLPKGNWRRINLDDPSVISDDLPDLYIKPGSIIPAGPKMQYVGEKPLDPLTLHVSLDQNGKARGTLYEDAGEGHGYLKGEYLLTTYEASLEGDAVKVQVVGTEGNLSRPKRSVRVEVHVDPQAVLTVKKGAVKNVSAHVEASGKDGDVIVVPMDGKAKR